MSQVPQRFKPRRRTTSHGDFFKGFRKLIAFGLAALLLQAPLGFRVSAVQVAETNSKPQPGDQFTIYQDTNGNVVCREATLLEKEQASAVDTESLGLQQINHLEYQKGDRATKALPGDNVGTGLTIILRATSQLQANPTAVNAFNRAAQNWEKIIQSPITIYIDVDYGTKNFGQTWGAGVLGSTSAPSSAYPYQSVRTNLIAEANGENNPTKQAFFNALPPNTVPTDLGDKSSTVVSDSAARAIGLLTPATAQPTDPAARIAFNSNFRFDFNPDDGIAADQTDFDAVATHEIGHALGFHSEEGSTARPSVWDLYRFRTGTNSSTFTTAQRILTIGGSPDPLQYYFVPDNSEVGLSTGGPDGSTTNGGDGWQSSHWKNFSGCNVNGAYTGGYIGIMDPAISSGCRRTITPTDALALTSFGYNLTNSAPPPPPPPAPTPPVNDNFANAQTIAGCSGSVTGTTIGATNEAGASEPNHDPSDIHANSPGHTVWYQWQAPSTGSATITTEGSEFDTILAVYTGSSLGTLSQIKFNDDVQNGVITTSTVTFNATAGTIYRIAVDGWGGDSGALKLNWSEDSCSQPNTVQLSQTAYSVREDGGSAKIVVTRTDATSAASVDYATSDTAGLNACTVFNGVASSRCDYASTVGTLRFDVGETSKTIFIPIVDDSYAEGPESFTFKLSNPSGMSLSAFSTANITIIDNDTTTGGNPIVDNSFFIRQQYIDFLGREPDSGGLAGWLDVLQNCGTKYPQPCDRIEVSAGFFRSPEFQDRGFFVFRFYPVALGRNPAYNEFMPDLAKVSGFLDAQQLEANKVAFVNEFLSRAEFQTRYGSLSDQAFHDALVQMAGVDPGISFPQGTMTRAQFLRAFVESTPVYQKFFNQAFVVMQYFGYLRRDPDILYLDWIKTMNQNGGDYRTMINGFMNSSEYFLRFGP